MPKQSSELSLEEFAAGLGGVEEQELSPEDFASGFADVYPEKPSLLGAFAGGALETLSTIPGSAGLGVEYGSSQGFRRGLSAGLSDDEFAQREARYALDPEVEAAAAVQPNPLQQIESGMHSGARAVYPPEQRGRGGLPEQLASGAGSIVGAAPAMLGGAATSIPAFGAMGGLPLYYNVLEKTGDKGLAAVGFIFGAATGQLERFGAEKAFGSTLKKLASKKLGAALEKAALAKSLTTSVGETVTEAAQQGLTDVAHEVLAGEDVENIRNIRELLGPSAILGGGFGLLDGALRRPPSKKAAAPQTAQEAPGAKLTQEAPQVVQLAPEAPAAPQEAQEGFQDVARPEPAPVRTVTDIGPETAPAAAPEELSAKLDSDMVAPLKTEEGPAKPRRIVQRIEEPGVARATLEKPHGIYTTPVERESPHVELGGKRYLFEISSDARTLSLAPTAQEELASVMRRGAIGAGAGVHAARNLLGADQFDLLRGMKKPELAKWAKARYPEVDFASYEDAQEVMEAIGAMEAKARGYDVLEVHDVDDPNFDEVVILTERGGRPIPEEGPARPPGVVELFAGPPSPLGKGPNITTTKVKKFLRRFFLSEGHKPREARRELELATGLQRAETLEMARNAKALDRAMTKAHGRKWRGDPIAETVDRAFEGDGSALASLNPEAQDAVVASRAHLDRLIRLQVKKGGVIDPDVNPRLAELVTKSQGKYANRFYRAHLDKDWAEKVDPEVRQRLFTLWSSWAQPLDPGAKKALRGRVRGGDKAARQELVGRQRLKGMTDKEIFGQMDSILQEAKEGAESPWKTIAAGKLGSKNLSIYKRRTEMPEELKAFLGEVKDPISSYANSVVKIAGVISKHEAYTNIKKSGVGTWLHEKPQGEFTAKIASEGNHGLAPLDGLYTTPEIKQALTEVSPSDQAAWMKPLVAVNAAIKWGKVIGQPWSFMRNLESNIWLVTANGHLPGFFRSKEWKASFGLDELQEQKRLTKLGVVGAGTSTAEWQDYRDQLKMTPEELALGEKNPALKAKAAAERVYEAADNAPKVRFFYAEEAALKKAGYSAAEAEALAADRTRDLMPTTERMAEAFKAFRKQPFLGSFFAFRAEVLRTTGNRLRLIAQELKSDNPAVRKMGMRRAAGQVIASTSTPALVYAINMMRGTDAEEDEDRREFVAPWDANSRIAWIGGDTKGRYLDMSDVDPFTSFSDPLSRVLGGASADEAMENWAKEEGAAFFGLSPLGSLAYEVYSGKTRDGKPIDNVGEHIWKAVQPGIVSSAKRAGEQGVGSELGAIATGFRQYDFDVEKSLGFDVYEFKRSIEESTTKRFRTSKKDPTSDEPKQEQELSRREAFEALSRKVGAAIRLGIPTSKVRKLLMDELSDESARAILQGAYVPYREPKKRRK